MIKSLKWCSGGSRISYTEYIKSKDGHEKLLFDQSFSQNCIKMKEIRPRGGASQGCARFAEISTFFKWTQRNWEFRRHRKWNMNRQFQCKSMKNYRAQTRQNLALTKIFQHFRKTSTPSVLPPWINQCDGFYFDINDECTRQILSRQSIQMSPIQSRFRPDMLIVIWCCFEEKLANRAETALLQIFIFDDFAIFVAWLRVLFRHITLSFAS